MPPVSRLLQAGALLGLFVAVGWVVSFSVKDLPNLRGQANNNSQCDFIWGVGQLCHCSLGSTCNFDLSYRDSRAVKCDSGKLVFEQVEIYVYEGGGWGCPAYGTPQSKANCGSICNANTCNRQTQCDIPPTCGDPFLGCEKGVRIRIRCVADTAPFPQNSCGAGGGSNGGSDGGGGGEEPACGNGSVEQGEQCDDGNQVSGDGCSAGCQTESCGNGIIDNGEACDDGNQNNNDACTTNCTEPACGDGFKQTNEQCDDGNLSSGDGCSAICRQEICGNSIIDSGEECDDGNSVANDACTNACRRCSQAGDQCETSTCCATTTHTCPNGQIVDISSGVYCNTNASPTNTCSISCGAIAAACGISYEAACGGTSGGSGGDPCAGKQGCSLAICEGNPFVCDDGDQCTQDVCNAVTNECDHNDWAVPIQGCSAGTNGGSGSQNGGETGGTGDASRTYISRGFTGSRGSAGSRASGSRVSAFSSSVAGSAGSASSVSRSSSSQSSESSRSSSRNSASSQSSRSSSRSSDTSSRSSSRLSASTSFRSSSRSSTSSACFLDDPSVIVVGGTDGGGTDGGAIVASAGSSRMGGGGSMVLVADWQFEEGNGTFVADSSGFGHHATMLDGATWTSFAAPSPLRGAHAVSFDGIDGQVHVNPEEGFLFRIPYGNAARTVSFWARPGVNGGPVISMGSGDTDNQKFLLQLRKENGRTILFEDGVNAANTIELQGEEIPSAGVWHHIVFSYDPFISRWTYYLDGEFIKSGSFDVPLDTVVNEIEIGSRHDSVTSFYSGTLDDIRIYSRVLVGEEVSILEEGCSSSTGSSYSEASERTSSERFNSSSRSSLSSRSSVSSSSSSRSSVRSSQRSSSRSDGFCGDAIIQPSLGEDCDLGKGNVAPGVENGQCACTPGDIGCTSPIPGLIWFRGCQWPRCGDGEVNNLMLRSTEFTNFDLIHEECDDGNYIDGDGCSALCIDELHPAPHSSARSSSRSAAPFCSPTACTEGGDAFCAKSGEVCTGITQMPCIKCIAAASASSRINITIGSSRSSAASSRMSAAQSSVPAGQCSACVLCGAGFANLCDEQECLALGPCAFQNGIFSNSCLPGPQCMQASSSLSSRSSARSSASAVAGYCGDNIVQRALGEDCDLGPSNVPPGTENGQCSCAPGEAGCVSPVPGLIWFRGCQWPTCGDGEVNNLMLRSTEFVNFDLVREECDDGNFVDGDGCSALCIDESKAFSSRASSRSSAATSVESNTCSMSVCADGGDAFCAAQSGICVRSNTFPCVVCLAVSSRSSVRSSAVSSAVQVSSVSSSAASSLAGPFIAPNFGRLAVVVFMDDDRDGNLDPQETKRFNDATITVTGITETGAIITRTGRTSGTGAFFVPKIPFSRNRNKDAPVSLRGASFYATLTQSLSQVALAEEGYTVSLVVPQGFVATTPTDVTESLNENNPLVTVQFGLATASSSQSSTSVAVVTSLASSSSISSSVPSSFASSALSLQSSSRISSSSRSSASSVSSAVVLSCAGNECVIGGNDLCVAQNMGCAPIGAEPCIVCLPLSQSSSSRASAVASTPSGPVQPPPPVVAAAECGGNECYLGGQDVCAARNLDCVHIDRTPCIQCVGVAPSSRTPRAPVATKPVSSLPFSCSGNECINGGNAICGERNAECRPSNKNPCFTCTNPPPARSSSPASASPVLAACGPNECASGGDMFCSAQGFVCSPSAAFPCFTCEQAASSRAIIATRPPVNTPVRTAPGVIPSIIPAPECVCNPGQRCVNNVCLTPVQVTELPPFCGNARLDTGESCDEGSNNTNKPNAYCRPDCTVGRCGDAIADTPLELCDDGNTFNGDGCSSQCLPERPLTPQEQEMRTLPASIIELPFQEAAPNQPADTIPSTLPGSVTPIAGTSKPPATADTGPAAIAVMAAGAAAGYAWMRRRKS